MKFTTPCFVRVQDAEKRKELIEWLRGIGYSIHETCHVESDCLATGNDSVALTNISRFDFWVTSVPYVGRIDCGSNIELFKALAAMNDENDKEQWFINSEDAAWCLVGTWFKSTDCEFKGVKVNWRGRGLFAPKGHFRKATVAEIIEHFTK